MDIGMTYIRNGAKSLTINVFSMKNKAFLIKSIIVIGILNIYLAWVATEVKSIDQLVTFNFLAFCFLITVISEK